MFWANCVIYLQKEKVCSVISLLTFSITNSWAILTLFQSCSVHSQNVITFIFLQAVLTWVVSWAWPINMVLMSVEQPGSKNWIISLHCILVSFFWSWAKHKKMNQIKKLKSRLDKQVNKYSTLYPGFLPLPDCQAWWNSSDKTCVSTSAFDVRHRQFHNFFWLPVQLTWYYGTQECHTTVMVALLGLIPLTDWYNQYHYLFSAVDKDIQANFRFYQVVSQHPSIWQTLIVSVLHLDDSKIVHELVRHDTNVIVYICSCNNGKLKLFRRTGTVPFACHHSLLNISAPHNRFDLRSSIFDTLT